MAEHPPVPSEYPWYMHHPTEPPRLTHTLEEAQALVDADPRWRLFPVPEAEQAAAETPSPRRRR